MPVRRPDTDEGILLERERLVLLVADDGDGGARGQLLNQTGSIPGHFGGFDDEAGLPWVASKRISTSMSRRASDLRSSMRGHFLSDEDIIAQEADFGKRKATGGRIEGAGGRSRPFGATICTDGGKSSLGALLRKRKVTGRDASLPAPLLSASLAYWSPVEQLGRCPKPHKGRRPLTLQGAIRPLTPFRD